MNKINSKFIEWYEGINKNKQAGQYSPHKPIAILFALAGVLRNERFISFVDSRKEIEKAIKFFTNKKTVKSIDPLYRLYANDSKDLSIWIAIPGDLKQDKSGNISIAQAIENDLKCGFSDEVYTWLNPNKAHCRLLIDQIIQDNFSEYLRNHLLDFIGITEFAPAVANQEMVERSIKLPKRDPNFKFKIRRLFDNQCAFCGIKVFLNQEILFLEAAHIQAKQNGGPCSEDNGLLLCPTHHYTFDRGVWSIDHNYKIVISKNADFKERKVSMFKEFEKQSIIEFLLDENQRPNEKFIQWHRQNILK